MWRQFCLAQGAKLNGQQGVVAPLQPKLGRLVVLIDGNSTPSSLPLANLFLV